MYVLFDVVSMYLNITLAIDHGIRAVSRKLSSVECIIDAIKIIRTCSNIQFKSRHYIPIKHCNQGPKDACGYTNIAMDEVHKFFSRF